MALSPVAICALAQTPWRRNLWEERVQGLCWSVVQPVLEQTGLDYNEATGINHILTCSDDLFDARTISDNAITDVVGAHYRSEEKVAQNGIQALYYGYAMIASGHADVVLIVAHCKESQGANRSAVTHLAFDPFYTRELGLDYLTVNALQCRAYMEGSGLSDRHLAELAHRALSRAAGSPWHPESKLSSVNELLASPMLASPIRAGYETPLSDGAIAMVLASANRAPSLTDKPVWITGLGNCQENFFPAERDLTGTPGLRSAAERAVRMASLKGGASACDLFELADEFPHHLPLWAEGLGLFRSGTARAWLEGGGPDLQRVNLSGGGLPGTPMILNGLARAAEVVRQLRGEAGAHQVAGARTGLAHGLTGPAGQLHTVAILQTEEAHA